MIRIGYFDGDVDVSDDELRQYDIGVNYYLKGHEMKLQASYSRQDFAAGTDVNEIILATQVEY